MICYHLHNNFCYILGKGQERLSYSIQNLNTYETKNYKFQKGDKFCYLMIEDLELEEWRTIEEFPRYQVSNYGRVKSCIGIEKILIPNKVQGYLIVKLSKAPSGKGRYIQKCFKVHRLVAKYFCEGFAEDKQVHHIDRQRDNNFYKNLLCVTKAQHAAIHKQLKIDDDKRAAATDNAAAFNLREKEIENNGSTESENNLHRESIRES